MNDFNINRLIFQFKISSIFYEIKLTCQTKLAKELFVEHQILNADLLQDLILILQDSRIEQSHSWN